MTNCPSCGHPPRLVRVVIPADLSHTGKVRVAVKPIDDCLADEVERLNRNATEPVTRGACCGHGRAPGGIELQAAVPQEGETI